jgi:multicomponent Na+:H+ antiporter subunit D
VSILTLFSMTKIWAEAFWKEPPQVRRTDEPRRRLAPLAATLLFAPIAVLALMLVAMGLGAESVMAAAIRAGEQLMNPDEYIHVVLGARR